MSKWTNVMKGWQYRCVVVYIPWGLASLCLSHRFTEIYYPLYTCTVYTVSGSLVHKVLATALSDVFTY